MSAVICLGVPAKRLPSVAGAVWLQQPFDLAARAPADVVVRWGTLAGPDARLREFNRRAALARALQRPQRLEVLRAAGIPLAARVPRYFYRVAVWDLRPCLVRRVRRGRRRRRTGIRALDPDSSKVVRYATYAATRAVHALRLDFGVVDLRVRSQKDIAVIDVDPAPPPDGPDGRALLRALAASLRSEHDYGTVLLGADPELLFRDRTRGLLVPASRFLDRKGAIGLDSARWPGRRGARPVAELRPAASLNPDRLVLRLRRLLLRLRRRVPSRRLAWIAGSGSARFPIGGHIHFGGVRPNGPLLRALDTYLAIPVLLLEDPDRARRRRRRYGWLGDFRAKDWGFEYRTLPSWLVGRRYARAVLHLALLVVRHWPRLARDPFLDPELHRAFRQCDKEPFYQLFPQLWADIRALPDYPEVADVLSVLPAMVERRACWPEARDIRRAWGIR